MKIIVCLVLILMGLSHCPVHAGLQPYNATTMNYAVTPAQAVSIIQTWTGNSSISLTLAGVYVITGSSVYDAYVYHSTDHQSFLINCYTGLLYRWMDSAEFNTYLSLQQANQTTPLPQSQLERAALAFAQVRYQSFGYLNMKELSYNDGQVVFCAQPVPGIWLDGNICAVDIDNYTGKPYRYVAGRVSSDVKVSTTASLSASQAEANALAWLLAPVPVGNIAASSDPVLSAFTTQPSQLWLVNDTLGQQRLVWMVYAAQSQTLANYTYSQWVQNNYDLADSCKVGVDANTGQVATYEEWLGGVPPVSQTNKWHSLHLGVKKGEISKHTATGPKSNDYQRLDFRMADMTSTLVYPPLQFAGQAYLYANYLTYGKPDAQISMTHEKHLFVKSFDRHVAITLNSLAYQVNGQIKQMSTKPILINDRCYVPLDVMNAVLPGKFTYDAKTQTVRYDPPQKKTAQR